MAEASARADAHASAILEAVVAAEARAEARADASAAAFLELSFEVREQATVILRLLRQLARVRVCTVCITLACRLHSYMYACVTACDSL